MADKIDAEIMPEGGSIPGVVRFLDQSSRLDKEMMTIGASIEEALGRGVIRDDNQRNKIIRYLGRLRKCHLKPQIELLCAWINASAAVGGHQRDEALMANAKLWVPEGGRKMNSKQMMKYLENQTQRLEHDRNNRNGDGKDGEA